MNLVFPDYQGGSIVNLAASVLQAFGADPPNAPCRPALLPPEVLAGAPGVVLLVCDALGFHQVEAALRSGRAPNLEHLVQRSAGGLQRLTSVFPSTTTSALPSLNTALTPAQHGLLGMRQWVEAVNAPVNLLTFHTVAPHPIRVSAELLRTGPTLYERLAAQGIPAFVISARQYEGSEFTSLLHQGAKYLGYDAQSEIPYLLKSSLQKEKKRSFYYAYWPLVDTLAHRYGPVSEPFFLELEFVDLLLGKIADCCAAAGYTFLLSADHGQIALRPERGVLLDAAFAHHLRYPPAGGRRAVYLGARDPAALREHRALQAEGIWVLSSEEAVARGWFGGNCAGYESRLGEVIALSLGDRQLLYDYGQGIEPNCGGHAGLDAEEMWVPLIAVPHH